MSAPVELWLYRDGATAVRATLPTREHLRPKSPRFGGVALLFSRVDPTLHPKKWSYDFVQGVPIQVADNVPWVGEA
jgi:hypothetical protein